MINGIAGFFILDKFIPIYGFFSTVGLVIGTCYALFLIKKAHESTDNLFILLAYMALGGYVGAKALFIIVSFRQIDWSKIFLPEYFMIFMNSGFVYYGGMIGGLIGAFFGGKIHHIDTKKYLGISISALPLGHAIGRLGCFFAGCCYGIPYDGFGKVVYHGLITAPSGISLFPVQLIEAIVNILIAVVLYVFFTRKGFKFEGVFWYGIFYGISRFILEFLRYDLERNFYWILSTSQWISLSLVFLCVLFLISYSKKKSNC